MGDNYFLTEEYEGLTVSSFVKFRRAKQLIFNPVSGLEITNPQIETFRGLRVGDDITRLLELYSELNLYEGVYYFPKEGGPDGNHMEFFTDESKVVKIRMVRVFP